MPLAVSATANAVSFKTGVMEVSSRILGFPVLTRSEAEESRSGLRFCAISALSTTAKARPTGRRAAADRKGLSASRAAITVRETAGGVPLADGRCDAARWNARLAVRSPGGDLVAATRTPVRAPVAVGLPDLRRVQQHQPGGQGADAGLRRRRGADGFDADPRIRGGARGTAPQPDAGGDDRPAQRAAADRPRAGRVRKERSDHLRAQPASGRETPRAMARSRDRTSARGVPRA